MKPGGPPPPGQVGELCLTRPWVGMTRSFWQDPQRYLETYWSRLDTIWVHGDWASVDEEGFWYIHGRSDETIKMAGRRVGPAEFESILVADPRVAEAAAVSTPHPVKGEGAVCFVVLRPGEAGSPALAQELRERVAREMGRPLAPEAIRFAGDLSALENPAALREIRRG